MIQPALMPSRFERAFVLQLTEGATVFHWDGATLHQRARTSSGPERDPVHCVCDIARDLVVQSRWNGVEVYRGAFAGEPQLERRLRAPCFSDRTKDPGFYSIALMDGVLYGVTSDNCRIVRCDLETPGSVFHSVSNPLPSMPNVGVTGTLLALDDRLLLFEHIDIGQQWHLLKQQWHEGSGGRASAGRLSEVATVAVDYGFWFSQMGPFRVCDQALVALSQSDGHHTRWIKLSVFHRQTLARLFTVECPMLYTRGELNYPNPYYTFVDAWDEQVLLCERSRGIGVFNSTTLNALAAKSVDGRLGPAVLHEALRWIGDNDATVQSAYFCGTSKIAAVWKNNATADLTLVFHDLSS